MRLGRTVGGVAVAAACLLCVREARAFCRTTTCPPPPLSRPTLDDCFPTDLVDANGNPEDFASYCASIPPDAGGPAKVLPLFWRNACVSYDIQKNASKWVSYSDAVAIVGAAFATWTQVVCPPDAEGQTAVSIQATNLGAVECRQVGYNTDGAPNQHVIIFHDDDWPYDQASTSDHTSGNTLGLTRVTFDAETGEIYDADTEINGMKPLSASDPVPADGYDLRSILTHEMGHFLGLAHSGDVNATMYASYRNGSTSMRELTADDVAGICSIYPPNRTRNVDPTVSASGAIARDSCNPTPRHGWSSRCDELQASGCAFGPAGPTGGARNTVAFVAALAALGVARRRRRKDHV